MAPNVATHNLLHGLGHRTQGRRTILPWTKGMGGPSCLLKRPPDATDCGGVQLSANQPSCKFSHVHHSAPQYNGKFCMAPSANVQCIKSPTSLLIRVYTPLTFLPFSLVSAVSHNMLVIYYTDSSYTLYCKHIHHPITETQFI